MALPDSLAEHITSARSSIARVNGFDAATLTGSALAFLATAEGYVVPDPSIGETFAAARLHSDEFRGEAAGQLGLSKREHTSVENARKLALVALELARPSARATALGLDWS